MSMAVILFLVFEEHEQEDDVVSFCDPAIHFWDLGDVIDCLFVSVVHVFIPFVARVSFFLIVVS